MNELRRKVLGLLTSRLDREVLTDVLIDVIGSSLGRLGGRPRKAATTSNGVVEPVSEGRFDGSSGGIKGGDLNLFPDPDSGPSQQSEEESERDEPEKLPKGFAEFWAAYPDHRRVKKARAVRAWKRMRPPVDKVLAALAWQVKSEDWTKDGRSYVPHPSSYLNAGQWEDQPPPARGAPAKPQHNGLCAFHMVVLNSEKPARQHDPLCHECKHVANLRNPRPNGAPTGF